MKPRLAATVSSVRDDWRTPEWILDIARMHGPIALDPATNEENSTKALKYYTKKDDALSFSKPWECNGTLFLNPPFGRGIGAWINAWLEAEAERKMLIVPARVDMPWFSWLVYAGSVELYFLRKRVRFVGADTGAPFPIVIATRHDLYAIRTKLWRDALSDHANWVHR